MSNRRTVTQDTTVYNPSIVSQGKSDVPTRKTHPQQVGSTTCATGRRPQRTTLSLLLLVHRQRPNRQGFHCCIFSL